MGKDKDAVHWEKAFTDTLSFCLFRFELFADGTQAFTYLSPSFEQIFGISVTSVLDDYTFLREKVVNKEWEAFEHSLQKSAQNRTPLTYTLSVETENRGVVHVEVNANSEHSENGHMCFEGTFLDVTQQKETEKRLRDEKNRLHSIIEGTGATTWETNLQTGETRINERGSEILGHFKEELSPMHISEWQSLIHPDDRENYQKALKKHLQGDSPFFSHDIRIRKKDGSYAWVLERGKIISWDKEGSPLWMHGTQIDVTQHKITEEALMKATRELELYFFESLDLLCIASTDGTFIRLNPEWERLLGYSLEDLEGSKFLDYVHPEDKENTLSAIKELQNQNEITSFVNRYRNKNGTYHSLEWKSKPIGQTIYAVARDISSHIKLQQKLTENEALFRMIAEGATDVVWTTDLQLRITWVSPSIEKLTGYTPSEYVGTDYLKIFSEADSRRIFDEFKTQLQLENDPAIDKNRSRQIAVKHQKKDGSFVWISMHTSFLRTKDGKAIGIQGISRDISEVVEREQTITVLNAQQKLFLDVSEQLINATVVDYAQVIQDTMSKVSQIAVADRVYVFEYDHANRVTNNTFEWCAPEIEPQKEILQNVSFDDCMQWLQRHSNKETIVIDEVLALPQGDPIRQILEPQGIQSLISMPLFYEGNLYGFIGFDSVKKSHTYTLVEKELLKQYGNNLISTISRIKYIQTIEENEKTIKKEKEFLRTTLLSVDDAVLSTDEQGCIALMNNAAQRLTGWTLKEAQGRKSSDIFKIIHEQTLEEFDDPVKTALSTNNTVSIDNNIILISKDGTQRPIEESAAPIRDDKGKTIGVILVFRDFSEKKRHLEQITYLSFRDHLTGLYNRRFFESELHRLDNQKHLPLSIIMGDVNGLKLFNDSFGHQAGDSLLTKIADILRRNFATKDCVARIGGDEFVAILPNTSYLQTIEILKSLNQQLMQEKEKELQISISFGLATKTDPKEGIAEILKKAEDTMYRNKLYEGPSIRGKILEGIIAAINAKNPREKQHSQRVSILCRAFGEVLDLESQEVKKLEIFGLLHDIGKIAIADEILNKNGKLTTTETEEIKRHPEIGYRLLCNSNEMSDIADYVLSHHERWDGKGYPKGLSGENIPLFSRICAIADAFDAMTSERSYRNAQPTDFALNELQTNAGTQFDPELVRLFVLHELHHSIQ